jgi:hypothetical protein
MLQLLKTGHLKASVNSRKFSSRCSDIQSKTVRHADWIGLDQLCDLDQDSSTRHVMKDAVGSTMMLCQ